MPSQYVYIILKNKLYILTDECYDVPNCENTRILKDERAKDEIKNI